MPMRTLACAMLAASLCVPVLAQEAGGIGYPSVAAALKALKAKPGAQVSVRDGWTIIEDKEGDAVWSFPPPGHVGYPAAIKRAVVVKGGKASIDLTYLCQTRKSSCDQLLADFVKLNGQRGTEVRTPLAAGAPSRIEMQRISDDAFRLTLNSTRSSTVQAGQQELRAKAQSVCGARTPFFGRYQFETQQPLAGGANTGGTLLLKQDVSCTSGVENVAAAAPGAATVIVPEDGQNQRAEERTRAYFAAKDQGRYPQAYALLASAQQEITPFARWQPRAAEFNVKAGAVLDRTIKKITWYQDPPQSPPGRYAAVDFSSQFAKLAAHCGYLIWQEQADGSLLLLREEENALDMATVKKLPPAEADRLRELLGCKG